MHFRKTLLLRSSSRSHLVEAFMHVCMVFYVTLQLLRDWVVQCLRDLAHDQTSIHCITMVRGENLVLVCEPLVNACIVGCENADALLWQADQDFAT